MTSSLLRCSVTIVTLMWLSFQVASGQQVIQITGTVEAEGPGHRPIPKAEVFAPGFSAGSVWTGTNGTYLIDLHATRGDVITFVVKRDGFNPVTLPKGITPPLPVDFQLAAQPNISSSTTNRSLRGGMNVIDGLYDQIRCNNPPCNTPPQRYWTVHLVDQPDPTHSDTLVFNDGSNPLAVISPARTAALDDPTKALIIAYSESIQTDYSDWTETVSRLKDPKLDLATQRAYGQQLSQVGVDMCVAVDRLCELLEQVDIRLWDHYASIAGVCRQYAQAQIGKTP
jgi:hypothetical protein